MRHRIPLAVACALALAAALAMAQGTEIKKPAAEPAKAEPAKAAAPAMLGSPDSAKWTATTYEAATADANKKMLESGKKVSVTGEVVDVSCYLQLGKRGDAHVACGTKCLQNGQPIGIVDSEGKLYIVMSEEHHPRRDGQADIRSVFIPLLAKTVTVNGMDVETHGVHALFVNTASVGGRMVK
jgi:hypothetical protein